MKDNVDEEANVLVAFTDGKLKTYPDLHSALLAIWDIGTNKVSKLFLNGKELYIDRVFQ